MSTGGENYYTISHAFEKHLNMPLLVGCATIGRFFAPNIESATILSASHMPPPAPCLACASTGQRVVLHNNNSNTAASKRSAKRGGLIEAFSSVPKSAPVGVKEKGSLHILSFGKEPTALAAGSLSTTSAMLNSYQPDLLLFGAASSLLAYDVASAQQVFYNEIDDGLQTIVSGPVSIPAPTSLTSDSHAVLALVGTNCGIYGYDRKGSERFWAVTGEQVTSMALLRWNTAGSDTGPALALAAASKDYEIRIFGGEEVMASILEGGEVRQLVTSRLNGNTKGTSPTNTLGRFGYLLRNGTVGMYQNTQRLWRIKSKHVPVAASLCDIDGDGVDELVIGYENGRVEIRSDARDGSGNKGGEVLYREMFAAPVAAVLCEDYRQDGKPIPLVCTVDGAVCGLTLPTSSLENVGEVRDTQVLAALVHQRRLLEAQLLSIEDQLALQEKGEQDLTLPGAGLRIVHKVDYRCGAKMLDIILTLENAPDSAIIQSCVLVTDNTNLSKEGRDAICFYADNPTAHLVCPVEYVRNVATAVTAHVAVGSAFASSYQIHELSFRIPPFIMYQPRVVGPEKDPEDLAKSSPPAAGYAKLSYNVNLRMDALETWLRESFAIPDDFLLSASITLPRSKLRADLVRAGDGGGLVIEIDNSNDCFKTIIVRPDSMECCADVITSLGANVVGGIAEQDAYPFQVDCDFPEELGRLKELLRQVESFDAVRMKLAADIAETATTVKSVLVRAEDARLLSDMQNMKKAYVSLYNINSELLAENTKRFNNYKELKNALAEVNLFIQRAGRMRVGPDKAKVIAACRNALKEERISLLIDIIRGRFL